MENHGIDIPRPEHPRPQFWRPDWRTLNGPWSFSFDFGRSGVERGFARATGFDRQILVPFCPESALSGIGYTDYLDSIWYHRVIAIPEEWSGKRVLLHFGAVDYEAHVWLDGKPVGVHYGGSASFSCDLSRFVGPGTRHHLVINARDDIRSLTQPGGKQSIDYQSAGCFYTRVSGIWQSVWLEAVGYGGLQRCDVTPDLDSGKVHLSPRFFNVERGNFVRAQLKEGDETVAESIVPAAHGGILTLHIEGTVRQWGPEDPFLYGLTIEVLNRDGYPLDRVESYAGVRKIHLETNRVYLNNEPLYHRFVLDQGFYPGGIWTAPSDDALKADIELSMAVGFNGARLHQKVFEERFHYWADRLGYLTWAESPCWGVSMKSDAAARNFLSEWREIVMRDRNHPSILAWTPLNETWDVTDKPRHRRFHYEVYDTTKALDPTRPVNGASGGCQVITDLYAVHNYEQDPVKLKFMLAPRNDGTYYATLGEQEVPYQGQPYIVDEFGGIKWVPSSEHQYAANSWGYGLAPRTAQEFYLRLEGQVNAILALPHVSGYCYTQLTDVEQEQNGLYFYDRSEKFDTTRLRAIFSKYPQGFQPQTHDPGHLLPATPSLSSQAMS